MQCLNCAAQAVAKQPSRRAFVTGFACAAVTPVAAIAQSAAPVLAEDEKYMRIALEEARKADFRSAR